MLVAIDHYFKWCEVKFVKKHIVATVARFLEEKIIYRFGVPKYVLIDNGGEWIANSMQCAIFWGSPINSPLHNGLVVMVWWRG